MIESSGYGFMFKMENEEVYKGLSFASSENSNTSLHPKLEIIYNIVDTISPIKKILNNEESLLIYPNPATDEINVKFLVENNSSSKVSIINTNGQTIKALQNNKTTISLKGLMSGLYYI